MAMMPFVEAQNDPRTKEYDQIGGLGLCWLSLSIRYYYYYCDSRHPSNPSHTTCAQSPPLRMRMEKLSLSIPQPEVVPIL